MTRPVAALFFPIFSIVCFSACTSSSAKREADADPAVSTAAKPVLPAFKRNPEDRAVVQKEPVAQYRVRTDDKLNEQYFTVRLYETAKTMQYRITMDYEGLEGEDTVKLPDLGSAPKPELQKGSEPYSAILGIVDNDKKFRELKKIYVTPDHSSLKITTLKHYVVSEDYRLVGQ